MTSFMSAMWDATSFQPSVCEGGGVTESQSGTGGGVGPGSVVCLNGFHLHHGSEVRLDELEAALLQLVRLRLLAQHEPGRHVLRREPLAQLRLHEELEPAELIAVRAHEEVLAERLDRALVDLLDVDPAQELVEHVGVRVGDREAVAVAGRWGGTGWRP